MVTLDWLPSPCVGLVGRSPLATANFHFLPTNTALAALHHCQVCSSMFSLSSSSLAYKLLLPPFRHRVLLFHKSNMFCFLPCHLSFARCFLSCHCPSAMSFFLADLLLCHLWHLDILVHSNSDTFQNSMFLCLFLCRRLAPRDPRFAGLLFLSPRNQKFNRLSSISLLTASIFSSSLFMPILFSNFVRFVDKRPQDVIELLHVFGSVSLRDVTDQCCIC